MITRPKIIGLTGGIGSGKTHVAKVFQVLGAPVFHADQAGRQVLDDDPQVVQAVAALLGPEAYHAGKANRPFIASRVFDKAGADDLHTLNAIVHPAVGRAFRKWLEEQQLHHPKYIVREAAILFESEAHLDCDAVICVTAPEEVRIARVRDRDAVSDKAVLARMKHQWPQEKKEALSQFLIVNDGVKAVIPQVVALHQQFGK